LDEHEIQHEIDRKAHGIPTASEQEEQKRRRQCAAMIARLKWLAIEVGIDAAARAKL